MNLSNAATETGGVFHLGKLVDQEHELPVAGTGDHLVFRIIAMLSDKTRVPDVVLARLSKGRTIGEMSIIDSYRRSATVKAITPAKLVTMSQYGFETILDKYPRTGIKILKELARMLSLNLRSTSSKVVDALTPSREKVRIGAR